MKIELNKQLDKEMYLDFSKIGNVAGINFGKKIRDDHPSLTKENYLSYINNFYLANASELEKVRESTASCFEDVKSALFTEWQKYFGRDYGRGDYTCYLSIFNCNPRWPETKTFQVYYKKSSNLRKEVIAHELTHFAFYDFCHKIGLKDNETLWGLSEIFNVLFLNLSSLRQAIGVEEPLFYPGLKDKLKTIKLIWEKQLPAEEFIKESLDNLSISYL